MRDDSSVGVASTRQKKLPRSFASQSYFSNKSSLTHHVASASSSTDTNTLSFGGSQAKAQLKLGFSDRIRGLEITSPPNGGKKGPLAKNKWGEKDETGLASSVNAM